MRRVEITTNPTISQKQQNIHKNDLPSQFVFWCFYSILNYVYILHLFVVFWMETKKHNTIM